MALREKGKLEVFLANVGYPLLAHVLCVDKFSLSIPYRIQTSAGKHDRANFHDYRASQLFVVHLWSRIRSMNGKSVVQDAISVIHHASAAVKGTNPFKGNFE
jgi:hypothetical protein